MNGRRVLAAAILLCCAPAWAKAATNAFGPPRASWSFGMEPAARLRMNGGSENGSVGVVELKATTGYPLYRSERFVLTPAIAAAWRRFEFTGVPVRDIEVYEVSLPLSARATLASDWSLMATAAAGMNTDFSRLNGDDMRGSFVALAFYEWARSLAIAGGLFYSRDFGRDRLLPAAGAVWTPSAEWQARLMFPRPQVTYTPSRRWRLFAMAGPAGGEWSVADPLRGTSEREDADLRYRSFRCSAGVEWAATRRVGLRAAAGRSFGREIEIRRDDVRVADADAAGAGDFEIGLVIR